MTTYAETMSKIKYINRLLKKLPSASKYITTFLFKPLLLIKKKSAKIKKYLKSALKNGLLSYGVKSKKWWQPNI
jgi:hypothetical protein